MVKSSEETTKIKHIRSNMHLLIRVLHLVLFIERNLCMFQFYLGYDLSDAKRCVNPVLNLENHFDFFVVF